MSAIEVDCFVNIKTILFPTDFSNCSHTALAVATSLARDNQAELLIVHVEEPSTSYSTELHRDELFESSTDLFRWCLHGTIPPDANVAYRHRLLDGNPADVIVQTAEQENVNLIVMGTHGRSGVIRLLMGSVAEGVMRNAACPVLTCKEASKTGEENDNRTTNTPNLPIT